MWAASLAMLYGKLWILTLSLIRRRCCISQRFRWAGQFSQNVHFSICALQKTEWETENSKKSEIFANIAVHWLAPMIFCAVLTVCYSLYLSCLVVDPNQTAMDEQNRLDDCSVELLKSTVIHNFEHVQLQVVLITLEGGRCMNKSSVHCSKTSGMYRMHSSSRNQNIQKVLLFIVGKNHGRVSATIE